MIKINSRVRKWGNGLAIVIPSSIAKELGLVEGSDVQINTNGFSLVVKPLKPVDRHGSG